MSSTSSSHCGQLDDECTMCMRQKLSIFRCKYEILQKIKDNQFVIITGPTTSGKSNQVPQYLLEAGYKNILSVQPRRLLAISLAQSISREMNSELGQKVGYKIRYETTSKGTGIDVMTDGSALREISSDLCLTKYSVVILDEIQERSLGYDILLGLLKRCAMRHRPDLRVVLMLPAIQSQISKLTSYLPDLATIHVDQEVNSMNAQCLLLLRSLKIEDFSEKDLIDPPSNFTAQSAMKMMSDFGCIDNDGRVTEKGETLALLPIELHLASALFEAKKFKCLEQVLIIVAMMSLQETVTLDDRFDVESSEYRMALYNIFDRWQANEFEESWCTENNVNFAAMVRAKQIHSQLQETLHEMEFDVNSNDPACIERCFINNNSTNVAVTRK